MQKPNLRRKTPAVCAVISALLKIQTVFWTERSLLFLMNDAFKKPDFKKREMHAMHLPLICIMIISLHPQLFMKLPQRILLAEDKQCCQCQETDTCTDY